MFNHYSYLKTKFNRVYNRLTKEKPFLYDFKDFWQSQYIRSVETEYISDKFSFVKNDQKINYRKKLRRLFYLDDYSDQKLLQDISNIRLKILISTLSLIHNEDDLKFLVNEFWETKRQNESLKLFNNISDFSSIAKPINITLNERDELVKKIIKAKNELIKANLKISQRKVSEKLSIPFSSFRDKMKKHKIDFNKIPS